MEFDIAFASLMTALATTVVALTAAVLAQSNKKLLNRLEQQHKTDVFFRALPYRLSSYREFKNHYSNILTANNILVGSSDHRIAPTHEKIDILRNSLQTAEMFFANEGDTGKIYQLIKGIKYQIDEHAKIIKEYHEIDSRNLSLEEKQPYRIKCLKSSDNLRSEYVKLTGTIEDLLRGYD